MCRVNSRNAGRVRDHISNTHKVHCRKRTAAEKGKCKDVIVHELQHVYNQSSDDSLNKNYINRSASLYLVTRTLSQRPSVSLAWRLDREMRRQLILHEAEFTS